MEILSCIEHVGEALDHIVDELEVAPQLEKITEQVATCFLCEEKAVYKISG